MNIRINHGIELLCSVKTIAYFDHIKKELAKDNKKLTPKVSKIVKSIIESMSPMMKSDLEYYKNYGDFFGAILWTYYQKNENASVSDGLEFLNGLSYEDTIRHFSKNFEDDISEVEKKVYDELKGMCETKKEMKVSVEGLDEFKKYPQESKERFVQFLKRFFNDYYLTYKEEIDDVLAKKRAKHMTIAKNHYDKFVKGIAIVKSDEILNGEIEMRPFFSIFLHNYVQLQIDDEENVVYIVYGLRAEQRFDPKYEEKRRRDLFKSLSDETRVKILKALKTGPKYTTELAEIVGVSKATVSYHMSRLIILDIVKLCLEQSGRKSHYELNVDAIEEYFNGFIDTLKN